MLLINMMYWVVGNVVCLNVFVNGVWIFRLWEGIMRVSIMVIFM